MQPEGISMSAPATTLSSLDRFKKDLDALMAKGEQLLNALHAQTLPRQFEEALKKQLGNQTKRMKEFVVALPSFTAEYQPWYSEAKVLIKQLLPDRLADFVRHYEKPKPRKDITYENYRIEDCLQGLHVTRGWDKEKVVGPDAAIPQFLQQLSILKSAKARFESSLFDIRQLAMADLFDSELEVAGELAKNNFTRAAGAVAGVVLEKHLTQVCENHSIKISKQDPSIADLNDALKQVNTIDVPLWRFVQHLADIRNLCVHNKQIEPTTTQVDDLVSGVNKVVKTLF
jgi:hypothetical protein